MILDVHSIPKVVKRLLFINIGVYILSILTAQYQTSILWFGLIPQPVIHNFQIWRLFTYLFIHGGPWHLFLNMFALWMFGPEIEKRLGSAQFLFFYFFVGVGGGLFPLFLGNAAIGASTSIFGILVAFGMMFPNTIISLIFPPVSMKAKHFVIVFGVFQFVMLLSGTGGIAWEAHLGGMLFAYLYFRYGIFKGRSGSWGLARKIRDLKDKWNYLKQQESKHFIEEEINPILDKMSKAGIEGLTRKERQILKKAKHKI